MMRRRGRGDAEPFGEMGAAFLAVAKDPEYFYPRAVAEHLEKLRGGVEASDIVMMMQAHIVLLFGKNIRLFSRINYKTVDFLL